jgi:putative component of toxin-antitoxin plasmid stabilization module
LRLGEELKYQILQTLEFEEWYDHQSRKTQLIIAARLERLFAEGHWGIVNRFEGLTELKWISGLRVYTAVLKTATVIILLGGN